MSHKVFLSYAAQDHALAKLLQSKIKEFLPSNFSGTVDVITPQKDMAAGANIRQSIKESIEAASTVVMISSENSDKSPWVNYEVGLADAMGKSLVFVKKQGSKNTALLRRFADTARIVEIKNDYQVL